MSSGSNTKKDPQMQNMIAFQVAQAVQQQQEQQQQQQQPALNAEEKAILEAYKARLRVELAKGKQEEREDPYAGKSR